MQNFIFLTGQIPMLNGRPMTEGFVEEQTRSCIEAIKETLTLAECTEDDVVKSTIYLKNRSDFPGFNATYAEYFVTNPLVDRISFTGGLDSARQIVRNSAENIAQVSLALGGKSHMLIFAEPDLDSAVNGILLSIFSASGQSCVAGSRLYIQESIFDELLERVRRRASEIVIGDPLDENSEMGPLATMVQLERIKKSVANAVENGATLIHGGKSPGDFDQGWYIEPTILACPHQDLDIVKTEMFGPVVTAFKFTDEQDAIAMANQTDFGLASGIFTNDIGRAMQ